jgi:YD repeat-containing protein
VTAIDLESTEPFQVAQGSIVTDEDGARQATVLFPAGNTATVELPDGTTLELSTLSVRATEFTVGESGPDAMPAELPPTTSYTYCVEINADEAVELGAKSVTFAQPLPFYVDNFLGFAAGTKVPMGSYDREAAQWIPEDSGVVIDVVGVSAGLASLCVDGDGVAETAAELAAHGITAEEREQLASLYAPGQSVWRVRLKHFTSPVDLNWPTAGIDPAPPPPPPPDPPPPCKSTCCNSGSSSGSPNGPTESASSVLRCAEQVYTEQMPVAGTPFSLLYESDRVPGYLRANSIEVPLVGASWDPRVLSVYLGVRIAGRRFQFDFIADSTLSQDFELQATHGDQSTYRFRPSPYLVYNFVWDRRDVWNKPVTGPAMATVAVAYTVNTGAEIGSAGYYWTVDSFGYPRPVGAVPTRALSRLPPFVRWSNFMTLGNPLGVWDARGVGLGGWTLDVHHTYDPRERVVHYGNGGHSRGVSYVKALKRVAGHEASGHSGDGGSARDAYLSDTVALGGGVAAGPDGSVYLVHNNGSYSRVRKIDPQGLITTIAGGNLAVTPGGMVVNELGDGGPAVNAHFDTISDVALGADASLYVADAGHLRIRRVDPDGIVRTIAGTGVQGGAGNGGPATEAQFGTLRGLAVGPDGSVYVSDVGMSGIPGSIRRIARDGIITKYVGGSVDTDEVPAISSGVVPWGIDAGPDGSLYIADYGGVNHPRFRKVTPDGIIHHLKGVVRMEFGANAALTPRDIAIGPDGVAYGMTRTTVYALKDDTAAVYAGGYTSTGHDLELDGWPALGTYLGQAAAIAAMPNGELYVRNSTRLLRVTSTFSNLGAAQFYVPDLARNQVYLFDFQGRHIRTRNSVTGADVFVFDYDARGYLSSIFDEAGRETTIVRDIAGRATGIVGPYGQATTLTDYDANDYVGTVTDPLGQTAHIQYGTTPATEGLVTEFTDWRGFASQMTYDSLGRVTKDQDPLGGFKALTLGPRTQFGTQVSLSTALGVTTNYRFEETTDGTKTDTTTYPDATQSITTLTPDQITTSSLPDGTTVTVQRDADPIWGMRAPMTTTTTTLPSGLQRVESRSRTATRSASDPAVLTAEQVTETLNGRSTRTTFTPATRTYSTVSPVGRTTTRVIDTLGRTASITRPGAAQVRFDYDADSRLMATTQGTRVTLQSYYDSADGTNGYLESVTDPLSQTMTFVPDALGRTLSQTLGSSTTSFSWDGDGNMTSVTPPGKPVHGQTFTAVNVREDYVPPAAGLSVFTTHNDYDLDHRLTRTTRPDAVVVDRSYDGAGRLDLLTMPSGSIDYTYYPAGCNVSAGCAPGKVASISSPSGVTLGYTYDGMLPVAETWSGAAAGSVAKTHDNNFRTIGESVTAGGSTVSSAFGYDNDGLLTCASPSTCPSGTGAVTIARSSTTGFVTGTTLGSVNDAYTYNSYGELSSYTAKYGTTTLYSVTYDSASVPRDRLGRVVQKTETVSGVTRVRGYSYDVQGRLTDVTENGSLLEHYEYDLNGNRTHAVVAGQESDGVYDDQR